VPYYRRLLDRHGVRPADIRGPDDLGALPITAKSDLQAEPVEELVARGVDPRGLIAHTTSGASGEPLTIRRTWLEERVLGALRLRALLLLGMRPTDVVATLGLGHGASPRDPQLLYRLVKAAGLYRRHRLSGLRPAAEVLADLRALRPRVITGYAGVLSRLAEEIADGDGPGFPLRFLAPAAEVLAPAMRARISARFRAPVYETYGSYEFNLLAWQCAETGLLHLCDDGAIVEILRGDRPAAPGETGEVVATGLHAFAMPFIRYRLGDLVTRGPEPCPCGAPFATLAGIRGRVLDGVSLPGGRLVHPFEIATKFVGDPDPDCWVRRYRIVQERPERIALQLVPARAPSPDELDRVRRGVSSVLGPGVELRIDLVPAIAGAPGGKFRLVTRLGPQP
jgi:phenylacetate-CoA ligase